MSKTEEFDARGLICPLPVLKAGKLLRTMAPGAVLHLWADDPVAVIDIPNFCREAGHRLLSSDDTDDGQLYLIERGPSKA